MAGNVIGTSSYSEAMDLSDLDDCGYEQQSMDSPETTSTAIPAVTTETQAEMQDPPVKVRKKPGRKPNPASPALRKAQNRAAQRAFRERKERHMKDLESSIRGIKEHRDQLLQENQKMSSENEILRAENWYLKGIVLSLQLVCLQHKLVIPQHCPHVNEQTLSVLAQSIPESISSYLNVNAKGKLQISQKLVDPAQTSPPPSLQSALYTQPQQTHGLPAGSIFITKDNVQSVPNKRSSPPTGMSNHQSWYRQQSNATQQPLQQSHYEGYYGSPSTTASSIHDEFNNIPPLSPMSTSDKEKVADSPVPVPQPVMMANEPMISNLAAIQTLRLRLRLQSACVRMQSMPFAIQPTLLQLTIPHDPRIDLIPTPHMRDRMILYRDQFDLDDCFRCLLSGSVFHGGDPAIAGNWQLPAEFFEKYWFLTIDYDIRRYTNEWRKKQGLKEIKSNIPTISNEKTSSSPPSTTTTQAPQHLFVNNSPPPPLIPQPAVNLSYENLSGYLGLHLNKNQPSQPSQPPQPSQPVQTNHLTPIQLTNGYGMMGSSVATAANSRPDLPNSIPAQVQPSPWENFMMGSKNYDMMMTGLYTPDNGNNSSDNSHNKMDQRPS